MPNTWVQPPSDWPHLREFVEKELTSDWRSGFGKEQSPSLSQILDVLLQLAHVPAECIPNLLSERHRENYDALGPNLCAAVGQWQNGSRQERRSALQTAITSCEPLFKKLLALVDPQTWNDLPQKTRDHKTGNLRRPTLPDYLIALGLVPEDIVRLDPSKFAGRPGFVESFARMYRLRNDFAHQQPELPDLETVQGLHHVFCALAYAVHKHRRLLEAVLFCLARSDHLHRVGEKFRKWRERAIWLSASENPDERPIDIFATEELYSDSTGQFRDADEDEDWDAEQSLPEAEDNDGTASDNDERAEDEDNDGTASDNGEDAEDLEEDEDVYQPRRGSVRELLGQIRRMVLMGDPGAGKTTTLQYYAHDLAESLLQDPRQDLPCPLYLELRRCDEDRPIWDLLERESGLARAQLRQEFARGRWLVLLDGLNEVRTTYQEAVKRDIEEMLRECPQVRVVITTRPGVETHRFRMPTFRLDVLSDSQMEELLRKHCATDAPRAARFIRALRKHPKLWAWGRNPLHLYMLARVLERAKGELPPNRGQLMRLFVQALLQREAEKGPQTELDTKVYLLGEVAYETRRHGKVAFSREEFLRLVGVAAQQLYFQVDALKFLHEVQDNHLIELADEDREELAFAHELYQEYFAAEGLKRRYAQDTKVVEPLVNDPLWQEPLALLYGLLEKRDTLFQQVRQMNPALAAEAVTSEVEPEPARLADVRADVERILAKPNATGEELRRAFQALLTLNDHDSIVNFLSVLPIARRQEVTSQSLAPALLASRDALDYFVTLMERLAGVPTVVSSLGAAISSANLQPTRGQANKLKQLWEKLLPQHATHRWFRLFSLWCYEAGIVSNKIIATVVQKMLEAKQWDQAARWVKEFRLLHFWVGIGEAHPQLVYLLRDLGVLTGVAQQMLNAKKWRQAARWVERFDLHDPELLIAVAQQMLEAEQWFEAARWVQEFGLQDQFPPSDLVQKLLEAKQWDQAAYWVRKFQLGDRNLL
ncbi:MAG: hypothetical protein C4297_08330 [Gemmataceae bacterium]